MITKPWKPQFILDEEERQKDRDSLRFAGGTDVLNKALQSIPNLQTPFANPSDWSRVGGKWIRTPEALERDKLTQGRGEGRGTLSSDVKFDLPLAVRNRVANPVIDALTDAKNMLTPSNELSKDGKFQSVFDAEGPAKDQRAWLAEERRKTDIVEESDKFNTNVQDNKIATWKGKNINNNNESGTGSVESGITEVWNSDMELPSTKKITINESPSKNSVRQNKQLLGNMDQLTLEATDYGANPDRAPLKSIQNPEGKTSPIQDSKSSGADVWTPPEGVFSGKGLEDMPDFGESVKMGEKLNLSEGSGMTMGKINALLSVAKELGIGQPKQQKGTGKPMDTKVNTDQIVSDKLDPWLNLYQV